MNLSEPLKPTGPMPAIAGQALRPGDAVEGFEILQVIGLTSFGVLYLARNPADGTTAAVKEYMPAPIAFRGPGGQVELTDPEHAAAYERGLQAFLTEALTLSQFDHPNLLRVSAIWEANGTAYRSMPYLPGTTLLAWRTSSSKPASQAQLHTLRDGLLDALATLYQAGLAHGQIEPVNIYVLEDGQPVLMDFDAVHQAVLSNPRKPYVDAYADPSQVPSLQVADLHAVAAVLHYAVSSDWAPARPGQARRYPALADVLLRFKDKASALDYQPEFLSAIDTALSCPPADRPSTVAALRGLFNARPGLSVVPPPAEPVAPPLSGPSIDLAPEKTESEQPGKKRTRRPRRAPLPEAPPAYPLNSSERVLGLLANFERGPAAAAEDVEPFQSPDVPTLTEEAEPALPPMRSSLFDDIENGESLPRDGVGYSPIGYTPMPRIPRNPWRRRVVLASLATVVMFSVGVLGWQLFA